MKQDSVNSRKIKNTVEKELSEYEKDKANNSTIVNKVLNIGYKK